MYKLETLNELTLKATCDGSGKLFTKAGAFIGVRSGFCDVISATKAKKIILTAGILLSCIFLLLGKYADFLMQNIYMLLDM